MYFASTMMMVTIALVMSVTVTNIYSKKNFYKRPFKTWVNLASRFFRLRSHPTTNFQVLNVRRGKPPLVAHQDSSDILASQMIQSTWRESYLSKTTSGISLYIYIRVVTFCKIINFLYHKLMNICPKLMMD